MKSSTLAFLAAMLLALPAHAQLEAWKGMGEEALHTSTFGRFDGRLDELFAACDKGGKMSLPKLYSEDYKLTDRDRRTLERGMQSMKRYANIKEALNDGYLPSTKGFIPSVGLAMMHPDLLRDGIHNFDRPDVLTYIKKKDKSQFRLVGVIYAGGKSEPKGTGDFDKRARLPGTKHKASGESWDYDTEACVIVKPGESVSLYHGNEIPHKCKDGMYFPKMWRLYSWGLVYNPEGLFAPKNPIVDFLDTGQYLGPLCRK